MHTTSLQPGSSPNEFFGSLGFALLLIGVSLAAKLAWGCGWVSSPDLGIRATMALSAAYLMFTGNAIPKSLKPFGCLPHDSAEAQTFRRFAGWTWVLTALALVAVWLLAPVSLAIIFTLCGIPLAILLVILRRATLARG